MESKEPEFRDDRKEDGDEPELDELPDIHRPVDDSYYYWFVHQKGRYFVLALVVIIILIVLGLKNCAGD